MGVKFQQIHDFLDRIETEGNEIGYTWLIGAGMSVSAGMPLARDISKIIVLFEYVTSVLKGRPWDPESEIKLRYSLEDLNDFLSWYEEEKKMNSEKQNELIAVAFNWIRSDKKGFDNMSVDSPECYQHLFMTLLQSTFTHHKFLTALVRRNLGPNLAHLCLAAILRDHEHLGHTVFTTNFDDLLLKSLLSINYTARVFGDLNSNEAPDLKPTYPQIVHLHGRHTGYRLKNTKEQVNLVDPHLQMSFKEHIKSSSLVVLGYSGWDDLVMKTLSKWNEERNLIQGDIIWVPHQNRATILPETMQFLNSCHYGNVIIVENDAEPLNADSFMLHMLNAFNNKQNGFVPYRKEILNIAIDQHSFILKQLREYPTFDPEFIINEKIDSSFRYLRENDLQRVKADYHTAKTNTESEDLPLKLRASSLLRIGLLEMHLNYDQEAINTLNKSEKLWSELKNLPDMNVIGLRGEADAYRALAEVYLKLGDVNFALENFKISRSRYLIIGDITSAAYINIRNIEIFLRIGNLDAAERMLEELNSAINDSSDKSIQAIFYKNKADLSKLKVNYIRAEADYKMALQIVDEVSEPLLKAELMKNYGSILLNRKNEEEGMKYINSACEIFKTQNNILGEANIHNNIGDYKFSEKNIEGALEEYLKSYQLLDNTSHIHSLGNSIADVIYCEQLRPGIVTDFDKIRIAGESIAEKSRNAYLLSALEYYQNESK